MNHYTVHVFLTKLTIPLPNSPDRQKNVLKHMVWRLLNVQFCDLICHLVVVGRARGAGWRHRASAGTHQVSVFIVKGR